MNLQTIGYVKPHGEKIKVLLRLGGVHISMRLRQSGEDSIFFEDETAFLESEPEILEQLKSGKVVKF